MSNVMQLTVRVNLVRDRCDWCEWGEWNSLYVITYPTGWQDHACEHHAREYFSAFMADPLPIRSTLGCYVGYGEDGGYEVVHEESVPCTGEWRGKDRFGRTWTTTATGQRYNSATCLKCRKLDEQLMWEEFIFQMGH